MADLYVVGPVSPAALKIAAAHTTLVSTVSELVTHLFQLGRSECDAPRATVVVLPDMPLELPLSETSALDSLSIGDVTLLVRYFFMRVNAVAVAAALLTPERVAAINSTVRRVNALVGERYARVDTWTGMDACPVDFFPAPPAPDASSAVLPTMSFVLTHSANLGQHQRLRALVEAMVASLDFPTLLADHSPHHLARLCHCVGHWLFPAHELTNDDLVYCVVVMLTHALDHVTALGCADVVGVPLHNHLVAFVLMVRDAYNNGNPFHNFRHAVDVMQACFHYLVRLGCLPRFEQLERDPRADDVGVLDGSRPVLKHTRLVRAEHPLQKATDLTEGKSEVLSESAEGAAPADAPHLNALQSLGLLVAALGHDVGHPGVTNAFMIKHQVPTAQVYSDRSVLELYHSAVFINKILRINWPTLLDAQTDPDGSVPMRSLISGSILATDMAEHFEYLHRLHDVRTHPGSAAGKVRVIALLLIKCADISNVTRPLRVSAQWALVLLREFAEIDRLERIHAGTASPGDQTYARLPSALDAVVAATPHLGKGQLFFIDTFAEGLFASILELLPELKYTCDIIQENKLYWLAHS